MKSVKGTKKVTRKFNKTTYLTLRIKALNVNRNRGNTFILTGLKLPCWNDRIYWVMMDGTKAWRGKGTDRLLSCPKQAIHCHSNKTEQTFLKVLSSKLVVITEWFTVSLCNQSHKKELNHPPKFVGKTPRFWVHDPLSYFNNGNVRSIFFST